MYCRYCGNQLTHYNQRFCTVCGASVNKSSNAGRFIVSLLKGLCYFLLYYIVTSVIEIVYVIFIASKLTVAGVNVVGSGYNGYSKDFWNYFSRYYGWVTILTYAVIILALFVFFRIRKKRLMPEIGIRSMQASALPAVFLMGISLQVFVSLSYSLLDNIIPGINDPGDSYNRAFEAMFGNTPMIALFLFIAVATPVIEEIIFRGLIYTRMKKAMPKTAAIILSAIAFGAAHGSISRFIYAAGLGVLLAVLYEKYDSLWPCIILHAGFNAGSFIYDYMDMESTLLMLSLYIISIGLSLLCFAYFFASKPIFRVIPEKEYINEAV